MPDFVDLHERNCEIYNKEESKKLEAKTKKEENWF